MSEEIEVLGVRLTLQNVDEAMERVTEFLKNDHLDTISIITMNTLLQAQEDAAWKNYLESLDMSVIGELEVLKAYGITEGQIYDETAENEFLARLFWHLISQQHRFFLIGESREEVSALKSYLEETYPDIQIVGETTALSDEDSADKLVNEINSAFADVMISGLQGFDQDHFLQENRQKITGKIWLSLGEHPEIQTEAGLKNSWWSTLLRKTTFKRLAAKYRGEHNE